MVVFIARSRKMKARTAFTGLNPIIMLLINRVTNVGIFQQLQNTAACVVVYKAAPRQVVETLLGHVRHTLPVHFRLSQPRTQNA